jgi:hypothetical protein
MDGSFHGSASGPGDDGNTAAGAARLDADFIVGEAKQSADTRALDRPRERFNRTGTSACICAYPFLIRVKILTMGQPPAFGRRKDSNADRKGISTDVRRCFQAMFRSRNIPLRFGNALGFQQMDGSFHGSASGPVHDGNTFAGVARLDIGSLMANRSNLSAWKSLSVYHKAFRPTPGGWIDPGNDSTARAHLCESVLIPFLSALKFLLRASRRRLDIERILTQIRKG